jgi:hypothetical protein
VLWVPVESLLMTAEGLRRRLAELLRFAVPPVPDVRVRTERRRDGYIEQVVGYEGDEGEVPALLLIPEDPCGAGVVVHHQHRHSPGEACRSLPPTLSGSRTAGPGGLVPMLVSQTQATT